MKTQLETGSRKGCGGAAPAGNAPPPVAAGNAADITWRVHVEQWETDAAFDEFRETLRRCRLTGKIAFFTNDTHIPQDLETCLFPRFAVLARRVEALHRMGYCVGANHLCTLGHVDEDMGRLTTVEANHFTDLAGRPARGRFCPNDPRWRENYLAPLYTALARTGVDFIYTDDDIRLVGHSRGCFCDLCIGRINAFLGCACTREALADFFECADPALADARKRRLLQYNREVVADLQGFIRRTVHAVRPGLPMGVMDGLYAWGGYGFREVFEAVRGPEGTPVLWRPGGGFYDDRTPDGILEKANYVLAEAAMLPDGVAAVEAELENFNYQRLAKSERMVANEAVLYTAAGTTGVAYNVFHTPSSDPAEVSYPLLHRLEGLRPYLDRLVAHGRRLRPRGVCGPRTRDIFVLHNHGLGKWLEDTVEWPRNFYSSQLCKIGLPIAYRPEDAACLAIGGMDAWSYTDDELRSFLAGGVYLDARSARILGERGFGDLVGFDVVSDALLEDAIEEYADHPLNGAEVGRRRSGRPSFWKGDTAALRPHPGAKTASRLVDFAGGVLVDCASGSFENALGGRVFVAGYYPWDCAFYRSRGNQLKRVFRWLARERLPGYVDSFHRAALWVCGDRRVVVLNMSLDPAEDLRLVLDTPCRRLVALRPDPAGDEAIAGVPAGDGLQAFVLPAIAPWSLFVAELDTPEAALP